jgi:5-methylthioribose kinase
VSTVDGRPLPGAVLVGSEADEITTHLRRRGLLDGTPVTVRRLAGGVSNDVHAVHGDGVDLVVKRALGRLRVVEEWLADPGRVLTEASALRAAAAVQPMRVPPVLDVDEAALVLVVGHAGADCHDWKADLLDGVVDLRVAGLLGETLAKWHTTTAADPAIADRFASTEAFGQLRIDPFYRWVGIRHPNLATELDAAAADLLDRGLCLVHGDFSPKNVLTSETRTWVIDWEVAHYGDPVFDVAFMLSHLMCKSLLRPQLRADYQAAAEVFLRRYRADAVGLPWDESHLTLHTACLLLARMDGKSPVDYLDESARSQGRAIATAAISHRGMTIDELWRSAQ